MHAMEGHVECLLFIMTQFTQDHKYINQSSVLLNIRMIEVSFLAQSPSRTVCLTVHPRKSRLLLTFLIRSGKMAFISSISMYKYLRLY